MKEKKLFTTFSTGFINKEIIKFCSRYTSEKSDFAEGLIEPLEIFLKGQFSRMVVEAAWME